MQVATRMTGDATMPHPAANCGTPVDWSAARRILAVRPDNLGDVVMLTPALRALRHAAPQARLELLASPAGSALRPLLADVDALLTLSPSWQRAGSVPDAAELAAAEHDLVSRLTAGEYDAVLAFTSPTQSPWPILHAAMLAGVPVRVGQSGEFAGVVASHWVSPPSAGTHQIDRCLHLLQGVGVPSAGRAPSLRLPGTACRDARAAVRQAGLAPGAPFALLAPGASCPARRYPAARFAAVAGQLARAGLPVLVTGTAAEQPLVDQVVTEATRSVGTGRGSSRVAALPVLDVPALAGVVAEAAVTVANNSGGMHLADALGTPVVVAYAGTERLDDMRPRAVPAVLLAEPVPCSPCRQFTCPFQHECLDLDPARLSSAALQLVAGEPRETTDRAAPDRDIEEATWRTPSPRPPAEAPRFALQGGAHRFPRRGPSSAPQGPSSTPQDTAH